MVAIVSGNSLGLNHGSLASLGNVLRNGPATQGRNGEAAYVNVSSGNLVLQNLDSVLMGRGGSDVLSLRTYNSQGVANFNHGDGWQWGQFKSVALVGSIRTQGSILVRTEGDGSTTTYAWDSNSNLYVETTSTGQALDTILTTIAGDYLWTSGSTGATETYSGGTGLINKATDSDGNATTFGYDANGLLTTVTDADGESVHYTYTAGNLTNVSTSLSGGQTLSQVDYTYDSLNRLTSVSVALDPSGNLPAGSETAPTYLTTYTYDGNSARVAGLSQSDGSQMSFSYVLVDGSYRVASVTDGDGNVSNYAYSTSNRTTTITDPYGVASVYKYDTAGQLTSVNYGVTPANSSGLSKVSFSYTSLGELSLYSGSVDYESMSYDARGNLITRTVGGAEVERWTYSASNQPLTHLVYSRAADQFNATATPAAYPEVTRYVYSASRPTQLRFIISAEGDVTQYRYNASGQRTSVLSYPASRYDTSALADTSTPSESALVSWSGAQDQTRLQRQDLTYDFRGQLKTTTNYSATDTSGNGVTGGASITQYVYDQRGQLLQTISPDANTVTQSVYDALGRVVSQTLRSADGSKSQATSTQYDDAHGKTTVTLQNGLSTISSYDHAGRLLAISQSSAGAPLGTTTYAYDADGRLLMTTDATGKHAWMIYDAAGRKVADVDATGRLIEYKYSLVSAIVSTLGDLPTESIAYVTQVDTTKLTDASGAPTTAYAGNPTAAPTGSTAVTLASLRPPSTAGDVRTWNLYQLNGLLTDQVDSLGHVTEFRYDGNEHLISTTRYATPLDPSVLTDFLGNLAGRNPYRYPPPSVDDRTTTTIYDHDERVRATIDAEGYLTSYSYDAAGEQIGSIRYAKKVPGFTSAASIASAVGAARANNSIAALIPASDPADIQTNNLYNGKGQLVGDVDADGYLTERVYDANGQLVQTIRYANPVNGPVTASSTLANLRPASSAKDQTSTNTWDTLGRLATQTNVEGTITRYTYNEVGQLTGTTLALNTSDQRTVLSRYDAQGRLVAELSPNGAALVTGNQTQSQIDAIWNQYGSKYSYDAAGRRTSSTDPNGLRTVYFYDDAGRLRYTVDPSGRVAANAYDALGHIISTSNLVNAVTGATFTGLQGGLLSATANHDAASYLALIDSPAFDNSTTHYAYDAEGRVVQTTDPMGGQTASTYDAFDDVISETRTLAAGQTTTTTHAYDHRGLDVSDTADAGQVGALTHRDYDAFGRLIRAWDADGNETVMSYDKLGRMVSLTDPAQATRTMSYDAFGRMLTQTDARGATTAYAYNTTQRSVTVTTPEGVVITSTHNREGQAQSIVDGNGQTTTYVHDADGNLLSTTDALGTTSALYDRADRLSVTVNADGNVVSYAYNASNQVVSRIVDPDGLHLVTTYQYDAKGEQILTTDPRGIVTRTSYDDKGEVLTQTVDPGGLNLVTSFAYDAAGRLLTVTSAGGTVTQYLYDGLGRRLQSIVDPAGLALATNYAYDHAGNLVAKTDASGATTRYVYDADNRLTFTVDAMGDVSRTVYDANGNVVETIAYATRIDPAAWTGTSAPAVTADPAHDSDVRTVYDADDRAAYSLRVTGDGTRLAVVAHSFDGNGNVVASVAYAASIPANTASTVQGVSNAIQSNAISNPSVDRSTRNTYDAAGHLTWSVDGLGDVTRRFYDPNGQLVKLVAYANRVALGQNASAVVASSADRVSLFAYDAAGRQTFMVDALGSVTKMAYDADGNRAETIAYANRIVAPDGSTAAPSPAALASAVVPSSNDRITHAAYDSANRQVLNVDAEGGVTRSVYDSNGRIVARTAYANRVNAAALPDIASASEITLALQPDPLHDRSTLYTYDAAGRQAYTVDALGYVTATSYDGVGRVLGTTLYDTATSGLVTGATAGDVSLALSALGTVVTQVNGFAYDAVGNLVGSTDALGHSEHTTYDALGNKLSFTNKLGAVWTFDHDAAGRLIAEHAPSSDPGYSTVTTLLGYDALGNLISRTEAAGTSMQRTTGYGYDALGRQVVTFFPQVAVYDPSHDVINGYSGNPYGGDPYGGNPYGGDPYGGNPYGGNPYGGNPYGGNPYGGSLYGGDRVEIYTTPSTQTVYDAFGDAVANVDVMGNTSFKAYDKLGQVAYDVDAGGYVTRYSRDTFSDVTSLTRYVNGTNLPTTRSIHDAPDATAVAQAVAANSQQDRTITTQYDKLGRAVQVTQPAVWVFNGNGQSYQASAVNRTTYDAFGQVVQTSALADSQSNAWATTTNYYDLCGDQIASVDAMGFLTRQSFDAAGNITSVTQSANAVGTWNASGYSALAASASDRSQTYVYDLANRKISQTQVGIAYSANGSASTVVGNLTTTYGYDALGNLTRTTDALGGATFTYYDALGRISAVASPLRTSTDTGQQLIPLTVFTRDVMGNVVQKAEYAAGAASADATGYAIASSNGGYGGENRITTTHYDSHGNAIEVDDAGGYAHYVSYDAAGRIAKSWQVVNGWSPQLAQALYTEFQYDALGRQTAIITPASTTILTSFGFMLTESQSQAGSKTTSMAWNAFGEMTGRTSDAFVESFAYDQAGRLWRTDSPGTHQIMLYDLQGRQTAQIASAGSVGSTSSLGLNVDAFASAQAADAQGNNGLRRTDRQLDLLGRVVVQTLPSRQDSTDATPYRPVVYQTYDRWGNVLTQSDVRNAAWVTQFVYNAGNQVVRQTQPDGNGNIGSASPVTELYYDALGRQVAVRDADGHVNRQTWDAAGQLAQEVHADGGVVTHRYDAFGDQTQLVDADGNTTRYHYSRTGHNDQVTHDVDVYGNYGNGLLFLGSQLYTYTNYDEAGRKTGQYDGAGSTSYSLDARGNIVASTDPNGAVTRYAYDVLGHQLAEQDPNQRLSTWSYNADGKLAAHTDIGGATYTFSYDNAQQLVAQSNSRGQNLAYAYDGAGQLVQTTDFNLSQITRYAYNAAGQHVLEQTIQAGTTYQDQTLGYDTLGRLAHVDGLNGLHVTTTYDKVGNQLTKQIDYTTVHTTTVADYGYVQTGVDESGAPIYQYQQIGSHLEYDSTARTQTLWSAYDAMNRQVLVDGALNGNAADLGNVTSTQGHILAYDKAGNRIADRSWGTLVTPDYNVVGYDESGNPVGDPQLVGYSSHTGIQSTWYHYDAMNRLSSVSTGAYDTNGNAIVGTHGDQQAIVLDTRLYDGASRVLQSGPSGSLPAAYVSALVGSNTDLSGATTTTSRYDPAGRLLSQHVVNEADASKNSDALYDSYDAAGNLLHYSITQGDIHTAYSIGLDVREGYKQATVSAVSTNSSSGNTTSGTTTSHYDANGWLVAVDGTVEGNADAANARSFINDVNGHVLQKTQQGNLLDQLVVDGNVVGTYGYGVDPNQPLDGDGNPNYVLQGNFDLAYRPVTNSYPAAATGQYPVQAGDTLQSIAQGAYGDSSLWYLIADANSLSGNQDLRVGQVLNIPTKVGATHNNTGTYAPYDPSKVVGSTSPNLPTPAGNADSGGCGGLGAIIVLVVAVVVTIITEGATSEWAAEATFDAAAAEGATAASVEATATVSSFAAGAAAGAAGSIAGQLVGLAIGTQKDFSWSALAEAAISSGISSGLGGTSPLGAEAGATANAVARAAISSALTQGVSVAVGLQDHFSWRQVAASAVGAGVGQQVGSDVGPVFGSSAAGQFATRAVSGLAAGLTTAIARGGKVSVTQVAVDAFGNALGSSLAGASTSGGSGYDYSNAPDQTDAETARLNRYETAAGQSDGFSMAAEQRLQSGQTFSDAYGPVNSFDPTADAASFGRGPVSIGQSGRTVFINGDASPSDAQLIAKAQALMASGPSAFSYSSGSANDVGGLEALDSQAAQGVKYIGPDGGIYDTPQPPTVITGHRMTADEAAAYDAANGSGGDSIRAMTPTESFFAFTTLGQTLQGVGNGLANMAHGAVTLGKQTILTASDAVGVGLYGLNNALGGRHVDYPLDSALGKSLQTQGFGPTALNAVGGVVQGTLGAVVAPFRAMYLRDPSAFGESLPGAFATALPLLKGGAVAEVAGAEGLGNAVRTVDQVAVPGGNIAPNVRAYPDGSLRTPDGKFASVAGQPAPGTVNASNYAEFLRSNGIDVVGTELEVDGPLGVRKYDVGTRNPDGSIFGIEIKSGGAKLDSYQDFSDRFINQYGATGRGRIGGQPVTGSMTIYLPSGG